MKKIIMVLCLIFLPLQVLCADYIHIDNPENIRSLPQKWTFANGNKTGNFRLMSASILIAEGWREITVMNNKIYDSEIQIRTLNPFNIVVFADHAEITYTVIDKGLNDIKKAKALKIRAEGKMIIANNDRQGKWTNPSAFRTYFKNVIRPLIITATTIQEVKAINNGDEYTWPAL